MAGYEEARARALDRVLREFGAKDNRSDITEDEWIVYCRAFIGDC